jgi:alpha-galactosidase
VAKIVLVGAGSVVFTKNLLTDILSFPELQGCTLALVDIDPVRLETAEQMARWTASQLGGRATIQATADRRRGLEGADYCLNMIQVGMHAATLLDFDIPRRYGLKQTIGDTLGVGGVFRALRTIPVVLDICRDMQEVCPQAWLLNYSNPMAMLTWAVYQGTRINSVGLCHSVQGTSRQLAEYIAAPYEEVSYLCGGLNHMSWFLRFLHNGRDAYPRLQEALNDPDTYSRDKVRFEILRRLGYWVTESSEHMAEYVPYFIQHEDLIQRLDIPIDEYVYRSEANVAVFEQTRLRLAEGDTFDLTPSHEYAASIIHSMETGAPRTIYGNVANRGLISNLPEGCCVEVPCLVDGTGIHPCHVGDLPPQCAALNLAAVAVQELTVRAVLEGKREHVYHAVMCDPHTASVLPLDAIWSMTDELLQAHVEAIPESLRE